MQLYYFLDYLNLRIVHYREEYFYSCATIYHKGIDVSKMLSHKMGNPCGFLLIAVTATLTLPKLCSTALSFVARWAKRKPCYCTNTCLSGQSVPPNSILK